VQNLFPPTQLLNAAYFGITLAANSVSGPGALGLDATGLTSGTLSVSVSGNAYAILRPAAKCE